MHNEPLVPIVTDVRPGRLYRHHRTGGEYVVRLVGRMESSLEPVVTYSEHRVSPEGKPSYGETWVRPLAEFSDGRFTPCGEWHY